MVERFIHTVERFTLQTPRIMPETIKTESDHALARLEGASCLLNYVYDDLLKAHECFEFRDERHNVGRMKEAIRYVKLVMDFANPEFLVAATT